jgi:DnaJ-class molecular chaperone
MSEENDRCQECKGDGWRIGVGGIGGTHQCKECEGTGRRVARAGVSCAALVGASRSASEVCPDCLGTGNEPDKWMPPGSGKWPCLTCCGTRRLERIAPTTISNDVTK